LNMSAMVLVISFSLTSANIFAIRGILYDGY
jgi:hypothetical protein